MSLFQLKGNILQVGKVNECVVDVHELFFTNFSGRFAIMDGDLFRGLVRLLNNWSCPLDTDIIQTQSLQF